MSAEEEVVNASYNVEMTDNVEIAKNGNTILIDGLTWHRHKGISRLGNLDESNFKQQFNMACVGDDDSEEVEGLIGNELGHAELESLLWSYDDKTHICLIFPFKPNQAQGEWKEYVLCDKTKTLHYRIIDDDPYTKKNTKAVLIIRFYKYG